MQDSTQHSETPTGPLGQEAFGPRHEPETFPIIIIINKKFWEEPIAYFHSI
jgi:hypothetical protein